MNRRIWTGVVAGVLAAAALLTVGIGAYQAGRDDEVVTRVVEDGEVVRVVNDGWNRGPGFGFFLFPLLLILLVVFIARGRGWGGGWHRRYGPYGPPGRRPDGYGDPSGRWACDPGDPEDTFDEWHRRSHERAESPEARPHTPQDASAPAPPAAAPGDG
ncbi:MAG: hypothetical protein ACRD2C_04380 [Acidimicrobiales bacterium]